MKCVRLCCLAFGKTLGLAFRSLKEPRILKCILTDQQFIIEAVAEDGQPAAADSAGMFGSEKSAKQMGQTNGANMCRSSEDTFVATSQGYIAE